VKLVISISLRRDVEKLKKDNEEKNIGEGAGMTGIGIKGMSCARCAATAKKVFEEIRGIRNVSVDLEKGEAVFEEDHPVSRELLREKIANTGYGID
jgi:copper chaperone